MQQIHAEPVPSVIPAYDSPAKAIAAATRDSASWLDRTTIPSEFGQRIEKLVWTEKQVLLELASGSILRIWCEERGVGCELLKPNSIELTARADSRDVCVDMVLGDRAFRWERDATIGRLSGRTFSYIHMGGPVLHLYSEGHPIANFYVLRNINSGELFLFWDEDE